MEVDPDVSDVDQLSEVDVTGDEEVQEQINAYGSAIGLVLGKFAVKQRL